VPPGPAAAPAKPPTGPSFADVSAELKLEANGTIKYSSQAAAAAGARTSGLETPQRPGFHSYSTAGSVKKAGGVSGKTEAAHVVPQAVYRALKGTGTTGSAGKALTTPLPPKAHDNLDNTWISEWNARANAGREIRVRDVDRMVSRAIEQADPKLINNETKAALAMRLKSELYKELNLSPNDVIIPGTP